jgi:hypothetical protein
MLTTARMRLVPRTAELTRAEIADRAAFAALLRATVPARWPPDLLADALPWFLQQLETAPDQVGWLDWYGLVRGLGDQPDVLVASGVSWDRHRMEQSKSGILSYHSFNARGWQLRWSPHWSTGHWPKQESNRL